MYFLPCSMTVTTVSAHLSRNDFSLLDVDFFSRRSTVNELRWPTNFYVTYTWSEKVLNSATKSYNSLSVFKN